MSDWISRPYFLLLLLFLPLLGWVVRRSLTHLSPAQRERSLWTRVLLMTLIIFALSGFKIPWKSHDLAVVFAIDRSASITAEAEKEAEAIVQKALAAKRSGDSVTIVGYADSLLPLPNPEGEKITWPPQPDRTSTQTAKGLAFAAAVANEGKVKRIVLLSDGFDTSGRALEAAQAVKESGAELYVIPLHNPERPEVLVEEFSIPKSLRLGEPFDGRVAIRSNIESPCVVKLYADGFVIAEQSLTPKKGINTLFFKNLRPSKNSSNYEVEIQPERDTLVENNRMQASSLHRGEPKLLIVDAHPERLQPLINALKGEKIDVEARPPRGLPSSLSDLQRFDALFLSDISATQLSSQQMALYNQWVKDFGGGFAMLGGEQSFGAGGYFRTPIEAILPVRTDHNDRSETPSVALLIILDSSGSMSAQTAGQTKMSLANQGAALALDVLQPKDLLGVVAVDTKVHPVAPLARHSNKAEVAQSILRITAGGGGIYVYTSLLDAFQQLRDVNAKVKHVILFSDAADAEEKAAGEMPGGSTIPGNSLDLAAKMAAAKITISVVALGNEHDRDTTFLKQLAATGTGRFYLTNDALTLPQIFTTETMRVAQNSMVEEPILPIAQSKSSIIEGIAWDEAPLLLGYNITKLKPTAELLLSTEKGDPLLAWWRFGLGRVAAFTSDSTNRWAAEWLSWPGYGKFWAQVTRSLLRPTDGANGLELESKIVDGRLQLEVNAITQAGEFQNSLPLTAGVIHPDGSKSTEPLTQIAPGRYAATLPLPPAPASGNRTTWLNLQIGAEGTTGITSSITPSYPLEFFHTGTQETALRQLAEAGGGVFDPAPESLFAPPVQGVKLATDLSPLLLSLALLLFPFDIWMRRRQKK